MKETHHEEETVGIILAGYMVYVLEHTYGIINDNLGYLTGFNDNY